MTAPPTPPAGEPAPAGILVLVGNPSPASRTLDAATHVARRLAELAAVADEPEVIDLAHQREQLLGWQSPATEALKQQVLAARAVVVATPTYKATYTGLLKLFLDQFAKDEWNGLPTVAVMTGGSPHHALAVDVHLTPVLVEIGASLPARGLYLSGDEIDEPEPAIEAWWHVARGPLARALRA